MAAGPLVLFGAGNMGGAILDGLLEVGPISSPIVLDPKPNDRINTYASAGQINLNSAPEPAGILIIAIKPQVFANLRGDLAQWIGPETLVISIMAGVRLTSLTDAFAASRVIRAMPNTPGAIGRGVSLISASEGASETDIEAAKSLLAPLGHVEGPMDEATLQAATGLSSSGPAYVFLLAEALAAAAERQGVPADMALRLAKETISGSAALMAASDETPEALRKAVTSPNGVTQAALDVLMDEPGLPSLFAKALEAVVRRDRELASNAEKD